MYDIGNNVKPPTKDLRISAPPLNLTFVFLYTKYVVIKRIKVSAITDAKAAPDAPNLGMRILFSTKFKNAPLKTEYKNNLSYPRPISTWTPVKLLNPIATITNAIICNGNTADRKSVV